MSLTPESKGSTRVIDHRPPQNPVARVVRDVLFELEHGSKLPDGVPIWRVDYQRRFLADPMRALRTCYEQYGPVFTAPILHQRQVMAIGPEATNRVLVDQADQFLWRGGNFGELTPLLGAGVLTSDGVLHDEARTLLDPGFHRRRMESVLDVIHDEAQAATHPWSDGETVSMAQWSRDVAMRVAMVALIGFDPKDREVAAEAAELFEVALEFFGSGFGRLLRGPKTPWNRMIKARDAMYEIVRVEIARKRHSGTGDDLMSVLLESEFVSGRTMSDREITDQLMTLLFAGHDTTSSTLSFLLHELSRQPDAQATIADEVGATTRRADGGRLGFTDLMTGMPSLTASIDETLRMYPPVWIGARQAAEDLTLCGHRIPRGTYVNYIPWVTHHLPEFYNDPDVFDPWRFTGQFRSSLPKGAYTPFGGGKRVCLGQRFGLTVAHAVAAEVLGTYRLTPVSGEPLTVATVPTLTPTQPIPLQVWRR